MENGSIITANHPKQCRNIRSRFEFATNPTCVPGMVRVWDYTRSAFVKTAPNEIRPLNDPGRARFIGNKWQIAYDGIRHRDEPGTKVSTHTVNSQPPFGLHFVCENKGPEGCDRKNAELLISKDSKATITYGPLTERQRRQLELLPRDRRAGYQYMMHDARRDLLDEIGEDGDEEVKSETSSDTSSDDDLLGAAVGPRFVNRQRPLGAAVGPRFVKRQRPLGVAVSPNFQAR